MVYMLCNMSCYVLQYMLYYYIQCVMCYMLCYVMLCYMLYVINYILFYYILYSFMLYLKLYMYIMLYIMFLVSYKHKYFSVEPNVIIRAAFPHVHTTNHATVVIFQAQNTYHQDCAFYPAVFQDQIQGCSVQQGSKLAPSQEPFREILSTHRMSIGVTQMLGGR